MNTNDVRDAKRYRVIRPWPYWPEEAGLMTGEELDEACDEKIAANELAGNPKGLPVFAWVRTAPREWIFDADLDPHTVRPSAAEGWKPLYAEDPEIKNWRIAYYDITGILGFPAMAMSPAQAHESVILPRVRELVASTKWLAHTKMMNALEVIRDADEDCRRDDLKRLSPYVRRMIDEALESAK